MALGNRFWIGLIVVSATFFSTGTCLQAQQTRAQFSAKKSPSNSPSPQAVSVLQVAPDEGAVQEADPNPTAAAEPGNGSRGTAGSRNNRQEIRSMDILERPYRFGHFYGNAVRRRHH